MNLTDYKKALSAARADRRRLMRYVNDYDVLQVALAKLQNELAEAKSIISERESRLAQIKFLLEPVYGSTNYAPIGGVLDRVLNVCDL